MPYSVLYLWYRSNIRTENNAYTYNMAIVRHTMGDDVKIGEK